MDRLDPRGLGNRTIGIAGRQNRDHGEQMTNVGNERAEYIIAVAASVAPRVAVRNVSILARQSEELVVIELLASEQMKIRTSASRLVVVCCRGTCY